MMRVIYWGVPLLENLDVRQFCKTFYALLETNGFSIKPANCDQPLAKRKRQPRRDASAWMIYPITD